MTAKPLIFDEWCADMESSHPVVTHNSRTGAKLCPLPIIHVIVMKMETSQRT